VNVLVIGSGGREHALCWTLSRSARIFCAPGNPGTAQLGTNLPLDPADHASIVSAVAEHKIDLTVIGPEAPLAAGLVDSLDEAGCAAFGPKASAAKIEGSKAFAKEIMLQAGVPTAQAAIFTDEQQALSFIETHPEPLVVKASGLAAGKGAIVCQSRSAAETAARQMFAGKFGSAGERVLVEECLEGEELSVLALTDGEQIMLLPSSQDHKRLGEGDTGPNTGGMGAYTPVSPATPEMLARVSGEVIRPVLRHLANLGAPYRGVLYAGIMITAAGDPKVLEFNCRFGDPEAQAVLPTADGSLLEHMWQIASGDPWHPTRDSDAPTRAAVTTVLASPGYPDAPATGKVISIPVELPEETLLFHAGTRLDRSGNLLSAGGRVLCATGLGADVPEAAERSRELAQAVDFEGKVYRRDIAWREVARAGAA